MEQDDIEVLSDPSDTAPPQLTDFSLLPIVIDTTVGVQQVVVTMDITDDLTGNACPPLEVRFRSPSGSQFRGASCSGPAGFKLVAGSDTNGTWQGTIEFPQFSEGGTWRIRFVSLRDAIGNRAFLDADDVELLGLPTTLIVVKPSLALDATVDPVLGGTVIDDDFLAVQVTFPPNLLEASTDVFIDVFESPLDVPMPAGFVAPISHFVNIKLSPQPDFPLPAPGLTVVLPLAEFSLPGTSLDLFRIESGTGQLVPALDISETPIVGTVDPSDLSATFTGISKLSTMVALTNKLGVLIDIKPGDMRNSINPRSQGKIPVAILSAEDFNAPAEDSEAVLTGVTISDEALEGRDSVRTVGR